MYLNVTELNELIYSLGIAEMKGSFVDKEINNRLRDKLTTELEKRNAEVTEQCEKDKLDRSLSMGIKFSYKGEF
jgi:hypothetical protein